MKSLFVFLNDTFVCSGLYEQGLNMKKLFFSYSRIGRDCPFYAGKQGMESLSSHVKSSCPFETEDKDSGWIGFVFSLQEG